VSARFRYGRSRRTRSAVCSPGNARWFAPRCGREEIELNLLQLAPSGAAEPAATPSEIMRREFTNADLRSELFDDVPNQLFRHNFTPNSACAAHTPEKAADVDTGGRSPFVQQAMHPLGNRNGSNVTALPTQVYDSPMSFNVAAGGRRSAWLARDGEVRMRAVRRAVHGRACL